jgi:hypothetical protein
MPTIAIEVELLLDLLGRRDGLVRAITAGMASGEWDEVMGAFDGLLIALKRLEDSLPAGSGTDAATNGGQSA